MTLVLAKANDFNWETAMALLFLRAKDYRIKASDLEDMKAQFSKLNVTTSQEVLTFFQSRKQAASAQLDERRLPELHSTSPLQAKLEYTRGATESGCVQRSQVVGRVRCEVFRHCSSSILIKSLNTPRKIRRLRRPH